MEVFREFLEGLDNPSQHSRTEEVLGWITNQYPDLVPVIKWNQPMFTHHGTFIIGFSASKQHLAVAPEREGIMHFSESIVEAGYEHTKMLIRIPWKSTVNYSLLKKMIDFNMMDKADCTTFWRK
ncbi:iron chaperone [Rossellomorea aquimaris]|uniref:iron chaperone n=1 Tax=Rossellomorea aquimaris TaxID=189382 RepID=UPI001CD2601F|nr:iron chaperone [Rossellomorea aquimaris]MCA1056788.1 iron chaperone [Rossellomorea aquimaris]